MDSEDQLFMSGGLVGVVFFYGQLFFIFLRKLSEVCG